MSWDLCVAADWEWHEHREIYEPQVDFTQGHTWKGTFFSRPEPTVKESKEKFSGKFKVCFGVWQVQVSVCLLLFIYKKKKQQQQIDSNVSKNRFVSIGNLLSVIKLRETRGNKPGKSVIIMLLASWWTTFSPSRCYFLLSQAAFLYKFQKIADYSVMSWLVPSNFCNYVFFFTSHLTHFEWATKVSVFHHRFSFTTLESRFDLTLWKHASLGSSFWQQQDILFRWGKTVIPLRVESITWLGFLGHHLHSDISPGAA